MSIKELIQKPLPELIEFAHEQEPNAFTALEHRIKPRLSKYARAMTRSAEDKEDAMQEVLIKLSFEIAGDDYEEQGEFYGMIYTMTENVCNNMYRYSHPAVHDEEILSNVKDDEPDELALVAEKEEHELLHEGLYKAIPQLSPQQQTVVLLKIKEEKSYKEIGEMLGKSEDEVRSIFSKALKKLKEIMTSLKGNEKKFAALVLEMTPYSAITKETMIKHRKSKRDNSLNSFNN